LHFKSRQFRKASTGEGIGKLWAQPKETLAAALLDMGFKSSLLDPLCGSGTLPLEAGLKALNIAPSLFRKKFGFESFADFDEQLWQELLTEAQNSKIPEPRHQFLAAIATNAV